VSAKRFHVVMVSQTGYSRISSHKSLPEAADATVALHRRFVCSGAVLRDGRTGKRYSVRGLIAGGYVSDSLIESHERVYRVLDARPAPFAFAGIPS
jgi:hypothetical protein